MLHAFVDDMDGDEVDGDEEIVEEGTEGDTSMTDATLLDDPIDE